MILLLAAVQWTTAQENYIIDQVCIGAERFYRIDGENGSSWKWSLKDALGNELPLANPQGTDFTDTDNNGQTIYGSEVAIQWNQPVGFYSLSVEQTSIHGCINHELGEIEVVPDPEVFAGDPQTICPGNPVQLIGATATNYSSLLWTTSGDGQFDDPTALNPIYTPGASDQSTASIVLTITATGTGSGENCKIDLSQTTINFIQLSAQLDWQAISCFGANDGMIEVLNPQGGSGQYQYRVDGGSWQSMSQFSGLTPGLHLVEMNDELLPSCITQLGSVMIEEPEPLTALVQSTNATCLGDDGTISIDDPLGGSGDFEFRLNTDSWQASGNFTQLTPGIYSVWMRNATQPYCETLLEDIEIKMPPPITASLAFTPISCFGANDGSITISDPQNGSGQYQYSVNASAWFDYNEPEALLANLAPGDYEIVMRDRNAITCIEVIGTITIIEPPVLEATIQVEDISCFGAGDGSIHFLNPTGGSGVGYLYSIDGGLNYQTEALFSTLEAGIYQLAIQDAGELSCTKSLGEVEVVEPLPLYADISKTDITCYDANDGTIQLSNPQNYQGGSYEYAISGVPGWSATGNFDQLGPGFYEIRMRDAQGCLQVLDTIEIIEPEPLTAQVDFTNTTCLGNDGTITVYDAQNSQSGTYEYRITDHFWQSAELFEALPADTFVVYIRDAALISCEQIIDTIIIGAPEPLYAEAQTQDATCYMASNGELRITLSEGGSGLYEYKLQGVTNYQPSPTFTGLAADDYTLLMRDILAPVCQYTVGVFTIGQPEPLYAEAIAGDVSCYGYADGTIQVTKPQGGSGGYEYSLDNQDWTKTPFEGLPAGPYTVTMRDTADITCTFTIAEVIINQPEEITATITPKAVSCYEGNDGELHIDQVLHGQAPYQYSIDGGLNWQNTPVFDQLTAGDYTIMIQDALGCTAIMDPVTISQPTPLAFTAKGSNETLAGANDGTISISDQQGGTGPYDYSLNGIDWQPSALFTGLAPNTYTVWMRDANNCTEIREAIVLPPGSITASYTLQHIDCYGESTGQIVFSDQDGALNYGYSIDGGLNWQTDNPVFEDLPAGDYQLQIRDANDPTNRSTLGIVSLLQPEEILASINTTSESFPGANDASITVSSVNGGIAPYEFQFNNGIWSNQQQYTGLSSGSYLIRIRDANKCIIEQLLTITPAGELTAEVRTQDILCWGENNGEILVDKMSGAINYEFSDDDGTNWHPSPLFENKSPGDYQVWIRDADQPANRKDLGEVTIEEPRKLGIISNFVNPPCAGGTGQVTIFASGGTGPYQGSGTFLMRAGETRTFILTDANGCQASKTVTMPDVPAIRATAQAFAPACYGEEPYVEITATGGTGDLYAHSNSGDPIRLTRGEATRIEVPEGSSYSFIVTDANNCNSQPISGQTPTGPDDPFVAATSVINHAICSDSNEGEATVEITGGTPPYDILWNDPNQQTTASATNLAAGSYTVTITDANNCITSASVTIEAIDDLPPTAICNNIEVSVDENGQYQLTEADILYIANGSSDNCTPFEDLVLTVAPTLFECELVGETTTVTLTVTDQNNNSSTCTATVTILDNQAPEIACHDITLYLNANGEVGLSPEEVISNIKDNCGIANIYLSKTNFTCEDVGNQTATVTAVDRHGLESSCDFTVTVFDTISPTIVCNDYTIVLDRTGQFTLTNELILSLVEDACGIDRVELDRTQFTCDDIGSTRVTLTAYDVNNNWSSCSPTITVVSGNLPPIAENDVVTTEKDKPLTIQVLANDSDPDGILDPFSLEVVTAPQHGEFQINADQTISYIPAANYMGTDQFIYRICDDGLPCETKCDIAVVDITVLPPNRPPLASDDFFVESCQSIFGDLLQNDSEPDGDQIIVNTTPITQPVNGTVTIYEDGTFLYEFERGTAFTDSFSYGICDDNFYQLCDQAMVYITIFADSDCDGVADHIDIDDDNDGIIDVEEGDRTRDTDGDGIPDSLDIDADNDGIIDNIEAQTENNYIPPSGIDENGNGLDDIYEQGSQIGIPPTDTDDDGQPDYIDTDSDNDNVPDYIEGYDIGAKGIAELIPEISDIDGDGLDDAYDNFFGGYNANDLDDPFGTNPHLQDFDNDGIRDWRDTDDDNDMIPTAYEDLNNNNIYFDDDLDFDGHPEYLDYQGECTMFIPEGFSPNGDGIHDFFQIYCIDKYPNAKLLIFDRWGNKMYEHEKYGNIEYWGSFEKAWWDGSRTNEGSFSSEKLKPGNYLYVLIKGDGNMEKNFVMISY